MLFQFTALPDDWVHTFCTSAPHLAVVPCDSTASLFRYAAILRRSNNDVTALSIPLYGHIPGTFVIYNAACNRLSILRAQANADCPSVREHAITGGMSYAYRCGELYANSRFHHCRSYDISLCDRRNLSGGMWMDRRPLLRLRIPRAARTSAN